MVMAKFLGSNSGVLALLNRSLTRVIAVTLLYLAAKAVLWPSIAALGYGVCAIDVVRLAYALAYPWLAFRMLKPPVRQSTVRDWLLPCISRRKADQVTRFRCATQPVWHYGFGRY